MRHVKITWQVPLAPPECKSRHGKHENFEAFLNSPKFFKIFLESFRRSYYSKSSKILSYIFWNVFRNFLIYFSRFYEIFIEILCNNSWNVPNFFLKIFKIILKNFDNISRHSRKYFLKFSKVFLKIFWNDYRNSPI